MSVQPFSGLKQADDFMNVYLHTSNSYNSNKTSPRWNMPSNGAICDRYKLYKRVVAVVNFVDLPPNVAIVTQGLGVFIRDISNQQMNSIDSLTNHANSVGGDLVSMPSRLTYGNKNYVKGSYNPLKAHSLNNFL